jgi:hypothetical protein
MKFDLQIRDLKTGNTGRKTFESVDEALAWLKDRPKFTDVLGMASHHISGEISDQLKAAMRPLDDEEKALDHKQREARDKAAEAAAKKRQIEEAAAAAQQLAAEATADPKRPMEVRWTFKDGLGKATPGDTREISAEVQAEVAAWVEERNSWVESRNQVVGDARLQVWPGEIPEGKGDERIISGTFIPVAAPKKD